MQQLADDRVGDALVDRSAHVDDPLAEQVGEEVENPLAAAVPGDDVRDEIAAAHAAAPIWPKSLTTWSRKPYSRAASDENQRSRLASSKTRSKG